MHTFYITIQRWDSFPRPRPTKLFIIIIIIISGKLTFIGQMLELVNRACLVCSKSTR